MADMNYAGIVLPDGKSYQTAGEYVPYSTTVSTPMSDASVQNLAPAYDATSTYSVGNWCVYEGTLYQCNMDIATAEAFDATKWDAKKIVDMTGSDIPVSSSSETIAEAIEGLGALSRYSATGSAYGNFSFKEINNIKFVVMRNLTGLAANALTTLDFTLPENFRPIEDICYFDVRQPSSDYTVRLILNPSGVVQIYNYGSTTGALNVSFIGSYI